VCPTALSIGSGDALGLSQSANSDIRLRLAGLLTLRPYDERNRSIRARLGVPTAINGGANKLARLFYRMLKAGAAYVEQGQTYEEKYKEH
jgi:hypothetical protein